MEGIGGITVTKLHGAYNIPISAGVTRQKLDRFSYAVCFAASSEMPNCVMEFCENCSTIHDISPKDTSTTFCTSARSDAVSAALRERSLMLLATEAYEIVLIASFIFFVDFNVFLY